MSSQDVEMAPVASSSEVPQPPRTSSDITLETEGPLAKLQRQHNKTMAEKAYHKMRQNLDEEKKCDQKLMELNAMMNIVRRAPQVHVEGGEKEDPVFPVAAGGGGKDGVAESKEREGGEIPRIRVEAPTT